MDRGLDYELARMTAALRERGALQGGGWGLLAALLGGVLAGLAARFWPLWYRADLTLALLWALLGGALAGAVLGYVWPRPLARRLRRFDRAMRLADRLTTAWELRQGRIQAPSEMARLQSQEALAAARAADVRAAFPLRLSREFYGALLATALALLPLLLLSNPQEATLALREAQQREAEAAAERLEAAREALSESPALDEAAREAALKALDEALQTLQDRRSTPEEQQAALTEAERQLAALRAPEAEAQVQRLSEAAPLTAEAVVQPLAEALQRGDVDAAAAYLRALTDPTSTPLTAEEAQALADAFTQIADALQQSDPALAQQFQDIAQEIYQGDAQGAREAVQKAADALSEVSQANAPNQALEQAQAGVQQAQEQLGAAQSPGMAQNPPGGAQSPQGSAGQPGSGAQGQSNAGGSGSTGEGAGQGTSGHHEDSGSSAPYGATEAERLSGQGGEITLPREATQGQVRPEVGLPNPSRVAYQDVYGDYVEAAEADLSRTAYPPALRAYVREYFGGVAP